MSATVLALTPRTDAAVHTGPVVLAPVDSTLREINTLEVLIVGTETDVDEMLWQQAARVVALLRGGMSQRALAREWLNVRTGKPYSQMHVCFTARAFEKFTIQPRPRFRATYNAVANAAKRDADVAAHLELAGADPADADLRVSSCADLFATGIRPDAVITELPGGAEHLHLFSELALACRNVPFVVVRMMDLNCVLLPEVLQRRGHLTWRGRMHIPHDPYLVLVFCQDDAAFEQAKSRPVPGPTSLRPWLSWVEESVQRLTDPGGLVCDPFMRPETAIAALEFGRRFVGCSLDAGVVADTRRQIGAAR